MGRGIYFARLVIGLLIAFLALFIIQLFKHSALPRQGCYALFRYLAREDTNIRTYSFKTYESNHFVVKFLEKDEKYVKMVAKNAEANYNLITGFFGFHPGDKTVIVMYPDGNSLAESFGWDKDERAMGVYWGGTIRILSPGEWIDEENLEQTFTRDGPIAHEFTHLLVDYMTRGNYSRWFTEGVAQYMEKKITGFSFGEPSLDGRVKYYEFPMLEKNFDQVDQSVAYWQSLQAVEYIVEQGGEEGLLRVIEALGKGYPMSRAIEMGVGMDFNTFSNGLYMRIMDSHYRE